VSTFKITLSEHTDKEKEDSISLMRQCFGGIDVATKTYYDWQYMMNPAGQGQVFIAYDNGNPAGQFACIPCIYKFHGKPITIPLTVNLCVGPKYRGMGLMNRLIRRMHQFLSDQNSEFSVGVPNYASLRGHLSNGYVGLPLTLLVRPIRPSSYFKNKIVRDVAKPGDMIWKKAVVNGSQVVKLKNSFDTRFDTLGEIHSKGKILIQTRSSIYLNWRYKKNPSRRYETIQFCDSNGLMTGYMVTRISDINGVKLGFILEFIANGLDTAKSLVYKTMEYLWNKNITFLIAATFPGNLEFKYLRKFGFFICPKRFRPHPFLLCLKIFDHNRQEFNILYDPGSWFFSIGDNDAI